MPSFRLVKGCRRCLHFSKRGGVPVYPSFWGSASHYITPPVKSPLQQQSRSAIKPLGERREGNSLEVVIGFFLPIRVVLRSQTTRTLRMMELAPAGSPAEFRSQELQADREGGSGGETRSAPEKALQEGREREDPGRKEGNRGLFSPEGKQLNTSTSRSWATTVASLTS